MTKFNFDLGRMTEAVNSTKHTMPEGLTRDEQRDWIDKLIDPDEDKEDFDKNEKL